MSDVSASWLTSMTSRLQARLLAKRAFFQRLQSSKKRSKLQAGFTLIELLIVVIIIGILSSIALPAFLNQRDKAQEGADKAAASALARKCAAAAITGEGAPTAAEITAAGTGVSEVTACDPATGVGEYSGGGVSWVVSGGTVIQQ